LTWLAIRTMHEACHHLLDIRRQVYSRRERFVDFAV